MYLCYIIYFVYICITVSRIVLASISNRLWNGFYLIVDALFDTFSVRARNLLNLQRPLFLQ